MAKELDFLTKRSEDYSKWYNELVVKADLAEQSGVTCMMGCMLESAVSVSGGAHLAAARSVIALCDLDGPSLCAENPYTGGPVYREQQIILPETPGIGFIRVPVSFESIG